MKRPAALSCSLLRAALRALLLALALAAAARAQVHAGAAQPLPPVLEQRADKLAHGLRCLV